MPIAPAFVAAPAATPLPFGLLSVADVINETGAHWQMGVEYFGEFCGPVGYTTPCDPQGLVITGTGQDVTVEPVNATGDVLYDWGDGTAVQTSAAPTVTHTYATPGTYTIRVRADGFNQTATVTVPLAAALNTAAKTRSDGVNTVTGEPFAVYAIPACSTVGAPDMPERARRALDLGESAGVERAVLERILATSAALDLTPGTTPDLRCGLALLEGHAASSYGGTPILHMDRVAASLLGDWLVREGDRLETRIGSAVAAGAGYLPSLGPDGTPAPAGEAWLYASGPVVLRRSPAVTHPATVEPATNLISALAERTYVATVDCFIAAVRIDTGC